jgi:hypothetical protein
MAEAPASVVVGSFRDSYRKENIGPHYSGALHLAFTSLGSLSVIALAIARVHAPSALELVTIPVTFLFANFVEYTGHKGPMHHRSRALSLLFERHTLQHHRYYTNDSMEYESSRDFKMVLFPPVMLLFFLGAIAAPIAVLLFWASSSNVAWLFVATAMGYFLSYEWLHLCHHTPEDGILAKLPVLRRLRRHHRAHHDPARMTTGNFNITFPICDWVFRTYLR